MSTRRTPPDPASQHDRLDPPPPADHWAKSIEAWARGLTAAAQPDMTPDQKIRSDAAHIAAMMLNGRNTAISEVGMVADLTAVAELIVPWIADGRQPAPELVCTCQPHPTRSYIKIGDPDCPEHGERTEAASRP